MPIHGNVHINDKELAKMEQYGLLKDGSARMWTMRKLSSISVVEGALAALTTKFNKYVRESRIDMRREKTPQSALSEAARISRQVLEC